MEIDVSGTTVRTVRGDLTAQDVEAVVNAANEHLVHGGGVAAAIVRAGGRVVQEASNRWIAEHGPLGPGEAAVTTAGAMAARHVVHVVGPRYREDGDNEARLRGAVRAALDAATAVGARSIALPAISAGVFGYPRREATAVIATEVVRWVGEHPGALDEVRLVGYDEATATDFAAALASLS